jgi:serine/threonine protein kinase
MHEKYKFIEKISKGTYGETIKVEYDDMYFCKKVYIDSDFRYGLTDDFIREILLLSNDITMLKLRDVYLRNIDIDSNSIIIDYYNYTLSDFIENNNFSARHLTAAQITNIIPSLINQLYDVHKMGFIHSDLKLENILEKKGEICICDWGLCEYYGYPKQIKKYDCTRYFKAPDRRLSINVDLFSLGASIYYLFTGLSHGFKDNLCNMDIEIKAFHLKKRLNKTEYNILKELIRVEVYRPSAKKILLNYYNFIPCYINHNFEKISEQFIDIKPELITQCYLLDTVFQNKCSINRVKIEKYTYDDLINNKIYELEYLDDTFTYFFNKNIQYNKNTNFNDKALYKFLKYYFSTYININTFLLAYNIFNLIEDKIDFNKFRLSDIVKIVLNYSCKILENDLYNIKLKNMEFNQIVDIEMIILNMFQNKTIEFIPYSFYIYYYITKIIQIYSEHYRSQLQKLESICLSIFFIMFINISKLDETNLHKLSLNVVLQSLYFIKNNQFDVNNEISQYIIDNSKLIPKYFITTIIEESYLRTYLYH